MNIAGPRWLKLALWPVASLLIFLMAQMLCGGVVAAMEMVRTALSGEALALSSDALALSLLASSVLSGGALLWIRPFGLRGALRGLGCRLSVAGAGVLACLCGILGLDILTEFLHLPDSMEAEFTSLSQNWMGVLALGIVGPVGEEIVFRGGVMEPLLRRGVSPGVAIAVSALLFGFVHFNPAQIPFAVLVGALFGIVYWRTRRLGITCLCHMVNNLCSVWLMRTYGDQAPEITFNGLWGPWLSVGIAAGSLVICGILMWLFWKRTPLQEPAGQQPGATPAAGSIAAQEGMGPAPKQ